MHEDGLSGDWLAAQGGVVGLADTEEGVVELSVVGVDVLLEEGIEGVSVVVAARGVSEDEAVDVNPNL